MMIDTREIKNAIMDGGSVVNVLLKNTWNAIRKPNLSPTRFTLTMVDQSKVRPMGVILDILVNVVGIIVCQDFTLLWMPLKGQCYSALLGREWLHATKEIQDWEMYTFILCQKGKKVTLPITAKASPFVWEEDYASSFTTSTESTVSSEFAYHRWMAGDLHEPNLLGEININSEADFEEFMMNWLCEAYESNEHSCFGSKRMYDTQKTKIRKATAKSMQWPLPPFSILAWRQASVTIR